MRDRPRPADPRRPCSRAALRCVGLLAAIAALAPAPSRAQTLSGDGGGSGGGEGAADTGAGGSGGGSTLGRSGFGPLGRAAIGDRATLLDAGRPDLARPDLAPSDAGGPGGTGLGGTGLGGTGLGGQGLGGQGFGGPGLGGTGFGAAGSAARVGGFGSAFGLPPGEATPSGRSWQIRPSLAGQLLYTDNALQGRLGGGGRRSDLITSISPSIAASVDTVRLNGTLQYAPIAQFYAEAEGQDRLDHRLNAQAALVLVPGLAFLDARGLANTQSSGGGFAPQGNGNQDTIATDRRNRVQTFSTQFTPYIVQRFGGLATAQLGYSYQYTTQQGNERRAPGARLPFFTSQEFSSNEAFLLARSGENFGPLALEARLRGTEYTGTGVLSGAHRYSAVAEARYVFVRGIAGLVEGGYEDQRYSGTPGLRISEPVWSVGARAEPGPASFVIARYGRRDGFNSASVDSSLELFGRTRLDASYSDRLTTIARRAGDLLAATSYDALGNPVDTATGAPVNSGDSFLALQGSLLRVRRAALSVSQTWPRDSFTVTVVQEQRRPISTAPGTTSFSQRGTSGSFTWAHELTPRTTGIAYVQYGTFTSSLAGRGDVVTGSLGVSHRLSETLVGNLQYVAISRSADALGGTGGLQNAVLAGLRKDF